MRPTTLIPTLLGVFILLFMASCTSSSELTEKERAWLESQDSIVVSLFPYYAPYQFRNKAGEIDGIFVDYLELIEEKLDYQFTRREYKYWPDVLRDAKAGDLDIVLEIQQTASRKDHLEFYDLFFESQQSLVTQKSNTYGNRIKDFKDKSFTLPVKYAILENLRADYPDLQITTELNDSICLTHLNQGMYDAYVGPRAVINHYKDTERLNNIKIVGELPYLYAPDIGVAKTNVMLNRVFAKAVKSITPQERLKIQDNWLFNEVKPFYKTATFWIFSAFVIGSMLLMTILLNRYLKFIVNKKTKQLRLSKDRALESNELRKEFIKNMSHEIRTPLNAIVGFSTLLKKNKSQPSDAYRDEIKAGASNLEKILNDISKISMLQTQQIGVKKKPVNIENLLINLVEDFELLARKQDMSITLTGRQQFQNKFIEIDGDKLKQALTILLESTVNYNNSKIIGIEYGYLEEYVEIQIQGPAIGRFESFAELQKQISRRQHSIGLSLTIAREHIVLLDGSIDYSTNKAGNSAFIITIPFNES